MSELRTFKCLNCGATLTTTAAPATTITCEYCATPFTLPARDDQSGDAGATVVANVVRRGNPSPMPPVGPGGEAPPTPEHPPDPDSPAGVGYTVDAEAALPAGQDVTPPAAADSATGPSAAQIIAEPIKHGVAIPPELGEPVVVPPNRVVVIPSERSMVGGPPGAALPSRSPVLIVGAIVVACCLLPTVLGGLCYFSGILGSLLGS